MDENFIFIENFLTTCLIGIYPEEKKNKQKVKISITLKINRNNNSSDNINSTVCYQKILTILNQITNYTHINLVETLANRLANEFEKIKHVKEINIKVSKCEIIKNGTDIGFVLKRSVKK